VLELLLENPEPIVSLEQFRIHIWPTNTFLDFDQGERFDSSKTEFNNVAATGTHARASPRCLAIYEMGCRPIGEVNCCEQRLRMFR